MKLRPVTKINKRNKTVSKRIDFILGNCDIIVIFPIYSQFGAIQEPDSGSAVDKTYVFINSNLLSYKNWE